MLRIYNLPKENRSTHAAILKSHGFDSIVLGPDETPDSIQPALSQNLKVWSCRPAFSIRHHPPSEQTPLLARDVDHHPQLWFNSGCPNQPALRQAHRQHVQEIAQGPFTGFMLDGIRFASPNSGPAFFTCFCDVCRQAAHALNLDFDAMRHAVRALRDQLRPTRPTPDALIESFQRDPGLTAWLRFRTGCIIGHVHEVRRLVDDANKWRRQRSQAPFQLGAYLFAPSLAALVGQNYAALAGLLDVVSPMLYRTLTPGDACLTTEYAALANLRLIPPHPEFTPADIAAEVRRARDLLSQSHATPQLVPILQLADDLGVEVTAAAQAAAPDGLDYFIYRPDTAHYLDTISLGTRASI